MTGSDRAPQGERHLHWEFAAFDEQLESGAVAWGIRITVVGYEREDDARIAAEAVAQRKEYRLSRVWECSSCGHQVAIAQSIADIARKA